MPAGSSRRSWTLALALVALSATVLVSSLRRYAADVGGIPWLPWPLAAAVNPPVRPWTEPAPAPPIAEIIPQAPLDLLAADPPLLAPGDVPAWRSPAGPVSEPAGRMTGLDFASSLRWRQSPAGAGNASPIVVGGRIYLTGVDASQTLWLSCHDLAEGRLVWKQPLCQGGFPPRHGKTSDAASTPCSDGRGIFTAWVKDGRATLAAHDLDGTPCWKTDLGGFTAVHGFASSPAWSGGLVVQNVDNGGQGFVVAVDAATGAVRWLRGRPQDGDGSYSSPVVATGSPPAVVIAGLGHVVAHGLDDGRLLWRTGGLASVSAATPVLADGLCICTSGYPARRMVAIRLPPPADEREAAVSPEPSVAWQDDTESEIPYVPTPAVHEGRLFVVQDDGVAHGRDLATGRVLWKKRVGGNFTASPVVARDGLLCVDEQGAATLLAFDDGTVIARFTLPNGCFATPVVTAGRVLFRTTDELLCIDVPR
jgi:outer membrane protein assembly factor BamB